MKKEFVFLLILGGCGGSLHKKKQLAANHYRQASLEIRNYQNENNVNALHKALNEVDKALETHPTAQSRGLKGTILLQLGVINQNRDYIKDSLPYFEWIIKDKNTTKARKADAKNNYATVLYQLGKNEEALKLWDELTKNPNYISPEVAFFNLGYAELNEALRAAHQEPKRSQSTINKHLEQAATYFRQALAISHEYIDAIFFLARTQISLNQLEDARNSLLTILTINPDHEITKEWLKRVEQNIK
ncbi:TPA: hypothetical protein DIC20_04215 [Candidatus Dependentiae bacterium]|nr:MAG: hypothetical protein US03_C0004G0059 [candidate division TM6 bacterium GW2011_GWF2_36_131]KKQ03237.1 MAG: hypothetical protein US13_C0004G0059 [candidate division TM6 bacterium GW2011_GWE2_36_25]KKQ19828.1 MAG: hypothetical protein US32_C0004G0012 [candidate division TM6 bacterium GW2011_GWA2_36_9]HBR70334.1 hypothetical protein [Candidatus Dependentiae bacterium]HCU00879.1 hypothetical protein [Candidatus Dependentiae bacterium]